MSKTAADILNAAWHLFTFQTYTIWDRWFEIACGIMAWVQIGIIVWGFSRM